MIMNTFSYFGHVVTFLHAEFDDGKKTYSLETFFV